MRCCMLQTTKSTIRPGSRSQAKDGQKNGAFRATANDLYLPVRCSLLLLVLLLTLNSRVIALISAKMIEPNFYPFIVFHSLFGRCRERRHSCKLARSSVHCLYFAFTDKYCGVRTHAHQIQSDYSIYHIFSLGFFARPRCCCRKHLPIARVGVVQKNAPQGHRLTIALLDVLLCSANDLVNAVIDSSRFMSF